MIFMVQNHLLGTTGHKEPVGSLVKRVEPIVFCTYHILSHIVEFLLVWKMC